MQIRAVKEIKDIALAEGQKAGILSLLMEERMENYWK